MRSCAFTVAVLAFGTSLSGCAATTTTNKVAVDYNRFFARSRDEVLVTNILRASAREPLQFSTMGTVTGGVRNSGSITLPVPSLIGAGKTVLSPTFGISDGINPNVTIVPLTDKEFTVGILKPVSLETINFFAAEGWDPEFVLTMVVGGVVCADGTVLTNRGNRSIKGPPPHYEDFAKMFAGPGRRSIITSVQRKITTARMSAKAAATLLKEGVGAGRKLLLEPVKVGRRLVTDKADVTIAEEPELQLANLDTSIVCGNHKLTAAGAAALANPALREVSAEPNKVLPNKVMLRSVESIIYFLGETNRERWPAQACGPGDRDRWPYYRRFRTYVKKSDEPEIISFFQLQRACTNDAVPLATYLRTRFNDENYYIVRTPENEQPEKEQPERDCTANAPDDRYCDRTQTTLGFLTELIALQTSGERITAATPIVAIQSK